MERAGDFFVSGRALLVFEDKVAMGMKSSSSGVYPCAAEVPVG